MPLQPRSLRTDVSIAALTALFIACLGRFTAILAIRMGVSEYWAHWSDDILTGVVAGCVLLVALRIRSAKRQLVQKRLREIIEVNHNVRNALQVISSSHLAPSEAERLAMVTESVARINNTLREFSIVDPSERESSSDMWRARVEAGGKSSAKIARDV